MTQDVQILIDLPMPIVTPHLILRPLMTGDGKALHEAKKETWDQIHKWMFWTKDGMKTPDDDEITARKQHAKFILREDIMITGIERKTKRLVLFTGLHRFDWDTRNFEIGYWVRESAQGQGYATESTNALTRYAFTVLNANRVHINYSDGNEKSVNIIKKLGFEKEGIRKSAHILPDGSIVDAHDFARINIKGLPDLEITWGEER